MTARELLIASRKTIAVAKAPDKRVLTESQYKALLNLFNECNDDFWQLPQATLDAFYDRLYRK